MRFLYPFLGKRIANIQTRETEETCVFNVVIGKHRRGNDGVVGYGTLVGLFESESHSRIIIALDDLRAGACGGEERALCIKEAVSLTITKRSKHIAVAR